MMVTNAVLGGIADTVAQTITAVRSRSLRKSLGKDDADAFADPRLDAGRGGAASRNVSRSGSRGGLTAIEIHELGRKSPAPASVTTTSATAVDIDNDDTLPPPPPPATNPLAAANLPSPPPPFDFERLTRFMAYGFGMAPIQFRWFKFLERAFPITKTSALGPALKRVVFDQLVFAPLGIAWFFAVMTVTEGGGRRAVQTKLRDMFVPTLKANFVIWPAVQVINFRLMPVQYQLVGLLSSSFPWPLFCALPLIASPSSLPSASPGPPTCRSPTQPRMRRRAGPACPTCPRSVWSRRNSMAGKHV